MTRMMKYVREPSALNVVWHSINFDQRDKEVHKGKYFVIGRLEKQGNGLLLTYLKGTEDYQEAIENGFKGFVAFPHERSDMGYKWAMESFKERLPARSRSDFDRYLRSVLLPPSLDISDFALLGYTEGRLPSDGFVFMIDFSDYVPPFDFVSEISGFRYHANKEDVKVGDEVLLAHEPENSKDSNAIAIYLENKKIGYINRTQTVYFKRWKKKGYIVSASIGKINGSAKRPNITLLIQVRDR